MGEYFRTQGDYKEANQFMEKLLFFYEDSMAYDFKIFEEEEKTVKKMCLLKAGPEYNTLFFRAILKFTLILLKKSCFRTSFSFTKFLLKLNPVEDPMGAVMMVDHVAILAKKFQWLVDFIETFGEDYIVEGS